MRALKDKIKQVQKEYDEECLKIDLDADYKKVVAKEKAVESIIGKFI